MFYDEKAIAEVATRIASHVIRQLRESNDGKICPRLMTVAQAAEFLGRTESSVRHLIDRGEIPVVRHGRSVRLDQDALNRWIVSDSN
jgi:excisionase family DNA binding protein